MTTIIPVETEKAFKTTASLATTIWTSHYTPIIGEEQVHYMLHKFQSAIAIEQQVRNGSCYYMLTHNEAPVGYFSYTIKEDHLFLSKLYVLATSRGKGIGKKALLFMETTAKKLGLSKIQLTVNKYNNNSIHAYKKMGFVSIKSIVQDIGNGYIMDDYVLEKTLL